jgi:hypothetical protein
MGQRLARRRQAKKTPLIARGTPLNDKGYVARVVPARKKN